MSPLLKKSLKSSSASSPYSLFGGLLSNSPPTPFTSKRQRAAAARRPRPKKPLQTLQPANTRNGRKARKPFAIVYNNESTHGGQRNSGRVIREKCDDVNEFKEGGNTFKEAGDLVLVGGDDQSYAAKSNHFRLSFDEDCSELPSLPSSSGASQRGKRCQRQYLSVRRVAHSPQCFQPKFCSIQGNGKGLKNAYGGECSSKTRSKLEKSWHNSSRCEGFTHTPKTVHASTSTFQVTKSFAHASEKSDPPPETDGSDDESISTSASTSDFHVTAAQTLRMRPGRSVGNFLESTEISNATGFSCPNRSRTVNSVCGSRRNTRRSLEPRCRTLTELSDLNATQHKLQVVAERIPWIRILPLILPEYPVAFEYIFEKWRMNIDSKLGEGSFSEVYKVCSQFGADGDFDVFKVIPVGQPGQPTFDDMLPEMSMCLAGRCLLESSQNRAPSFLSLRGTHLVRGSFTREMVAAYERFQSSNPRETEHQHPLKRPSSQFYVAFYTSYDGCEVESTLRELTGDIRASIILQITYGLATAEVSFDFEHRDLHLSNLVIKDHEESELEFRINSKKFVVKSFGKRASLIDYGMCRLVVDEVLHSPFEPEILVGPGLQRWTYREQHRMLNGDYGNRCLETNGLWIKFLIRKMFNRRPVNSKLFYADQINRLYSALCENHLSAQQCVEILENCELKET